MRFVFLSTGLDYTLPQSPKISVYAREVVAGKSLTSTFVQELICINYEFWLPMNRYTKFFSHHFDEDQQQLIANVK